MITPNQIALHLQECLPLLTDRFHDELPVVSGSVSGGILTITFVSDHGLSVDDEIMVNQAIIKNEIVSMIDNGDDTFSYFTKDVHDMTAYMAEGHGGTWPEGLTTTIEISGLPTTINLLNDASAIPSSSEFVGDEGSPVFIPDGTQFLLENRSIGVTGFKKIASIVSPTVVTVDLSDVPSIPDGPLIMNHIATGIRIAVVADIKRAEEVYTQLGANKAWLFVIMVDRDASKDRENTDDFKSLPGSTLKMLNIRQEWATYIMLPTTDNLGAGDVKSYAYVDLFTILNKCLYGWENTGYSGDGQTEYNTAWYGHSYDWETRIQIDFEDGYQNPSTVAFRFLDFTQTIFDEGESSGSIEY